MKILILVILYSQVFSGTYDYPVVRQVVASPESAAMILYERNLSLTYTEPGHNEAHLYELDLAVMSVVEIDIPEISFTPKPRKESADIEGTVSDHPLSPQSSPDLESSKYWHGRSPDPYNGEKGE